MKLTTLNWCANFKSLGTCDLKWYVLNHHNKIPAIIAHGISFQATYFAPLSPAPSW